MKQLPPQRLRRCGALFHGDRYYQESAEEEADRLVRECGLTRESVLVDFGCGVGRLAFGIESRLETIRRYIGVDIDTKAIEWAKNRFPDDGFVFQLSDSYHERFNPHGTGAKGRIPLQDGTCDIAYSYAVFAHMLPEDVEHYLKEMFRVLRPGGWVFATAHVEENVPDMTVNPEGYPRPIMVPAEKRGALHCVRYSREAFTKMIDDAGFRVSKTSKEWHEQTGYYLVK